MQREVSAEEEDLLQRSTKRSKESHEAPGPPIGDLGKASGSYSNDKSSYSDKVRGQSNEDRRLQEEEDDEGNTSDDDLIEEGDGVTWFSMGMTKMEKTEARRPWRNSL